LTHFASDFGISESLSDDVRGNVLETKSIVSQFPKIVPEHLFVQIPEQMEGLHANIGALELALEQAPKVFESVGVHLSINIPFRMVNDLVLEPLLFESLIGHERIGVDGAPRFDMSANISLQRVLFAIADYSSANLATTFQDSHHGGFIFGASLSNPALVFVSMHESSRTTDESLVYFDFTIRPTEFQERAVLHCKTDAVEHEPCGLLSDAKSAANFVRANTVFAIRNHPNSDEPFVERESGILKDSSHFARKLFASVFPFAFPHQTSRDESHIIAATSGALDAIRPTPRNDEVEAIIGVGEVFDGLLKSLWLGVHGVPHCQNSTRNALLSQVYYCPYKKHRGRGANASTFWPLNRLGFFAYLLCNHTLANSFASRKILSPYFS
jgi:hypothetical protein